MKPIRPESVTATTENSLKRRIERIRNGYG
jgi:hypothetical protein